MKNQDEVIYIKKTGAFGITELIAPRILSLLSPQKALREVIPITNNINISTKATKR